jgi:hypothetical protein
LAVLIRKAGDELFADRRRRAETMVGAAAEAADMTADEQADATSQSERTRFMADAAVRAAAESMWTPGAPLSVSFLDPDLGCLTPGQIRLQEGLLSPNARPRTRFRRRH